MSRSIEASGKTVKDAIQNGLKTLGCTLDEVETSVIDMGSPGLFGMFGKPAKVLLTVKEDDSFDIEMPVFSLDQPSQKKREKKAEKKVEKVETEAPKAEEKPKRKPRAKAAAKAADAPKAEEKPKRKPRAKKAAEPKAE